MEALKKYFLYSPTWKTLIMVTNCLENDSRIGMATSLIGITNTKIWSYRITDPNIESI